MHQQISGGRDTRQRTSSSAHWSPKVREARAGKYPAATVSPCPNGPPQTHSAQPLSGSRSKAPTSGIPGMVTSALSPTPPPAPGIGPAHTVARREGSERPSSSLGEDPSTASTSAGSGWRGGGTRGSGAARHLHPPACGGGSRAGGHLPAPTSSRSF